MTEPHPTALPKGVGRIACSALLLVVLLGSWHIASSDGAVLGLVTVAAVPRVLPHDVAAGAALSAGRGGPTPSGEALPLPYAGAHAMSSATGPMGVQSANWRRRLPPVAHGQGPLEWLVRVVACASVLSVAGGALFALRHRRPVSVCGAPPDRLGVPERARLPALRSGGPGPGDPRVVVRRIGGDDTATVAEVQYDSFAEPAADGDWMALVMAQKMKGQIQSDLMRRNTRADWVCLLLEQEGVPVACAEAILRGGTGGQRYLFNVGVVPAARKRGYGRMLIEALEKECPEELLLAEVWQDNERAMAFWEAMGYTLERTFPVETGAGARTAGQYYKKMPKQPQPFW